MNRETITEIVLDEARELAGPKDKIVADADFRDDLGFDSLDDVVFLLALEDRFDIEVHDEVAVTWVKLSDAIDWLEGTLA